MSFILWVKEVGCRETYHGDPASGERIQPAPPLPILLSEAFPTRSQKGGTWTPGVPIYKESLFDFGCGGKGSVFPVLIAG